MIVIDATDLIVGRLATKVAKLALLGEEVHVINAEKAVFTGNATQVFQRYLQQFHRGTPSKGPFVQRQAHAMLKRTIRGMIPYKKAMGKEAFARVRCYSGVPESLKEEKATTIETAHISKVGVLKFVALGEISKKLGA